MAIFVFRGVRREKVEWKLKGCREIRYEVLEFGAFCFVYCLLFIVSFFFFSVGGGMVISLL